MTCTHRLANGSLVCTLPAGHAHGCSYEATAWSAAGEDSGHKRGEEDAP